MSELIYNTLLILTIGLIFLGLTAAILVLIFLFFAGGVFIGAFCGYLLSFTLMGQWVHSALIAVGADMPLRNLGALLGFISSLLSLRLINPVVQGFISAVLKYLGISSEKGRK